MFLVGGVVIVGWDIGGAHLKRVRLDERGDLFDARQVPCRLWRGLSELHDAWDALAPGPGETRHALTMTGELVDCFDSREEGVAAIVDAAMCRLGSASAVVLAGDRFLPLAAAAERPTEVASANWRAPVLLAVDCLPEGLLLDVGSTTTDIAAFRAGRVLTPFESDHERLASGSLLYTGVTRTPLMAVSRHVSFRGRRVGVMAEHFATMGDVYRVAGCIAPEFDQADTADGRGRSVAESAARMAHMIGCDARDFSAGDWRALAGWYARRQEAQILRACRRHASVVNLAARAPLVGLGVGHFVAASVAARLDVPYTDFASALGIAHDRSGVNLCGPAYAVARLALRRDAWD